MFPNWRHLFLFGFVRLSPPNVKKSFSTKKVAEKFGGFKKK